MDKPFPSAKDTTRSRLIDAATEVFVREGYRAARVQDIALQAQVRLSAINYHFGGKEHLYREVLNYHADLAIREMPLEPAGVVLPLAARFQFAVHALVSRMLDPRSASRIAPLLLREMVNPTHAMDELIGRFSLPQARKFDALIGEILGPKVPESMRLRALISIFGQCVIYITGQALLSRLAPQVLGDTAMVEATARHITEFSWAGLQALRQQWETLHDQR